MKRSDEYNPYYPASENPAPAKSASPSAPRTSELGTCDYGPHPGVGETPHDKTPECVNWTAAEPRWDWLETELWNFARACTIDLDHTNIDETMRRSDEIIYNSMRGAFAAYLSAEPRRDEREAFEYWCREIMLCDPENLDRLTGGKGAYRLHNVQCWWMGWQAARASAAPLKHDLLPEPMAEPSAGQTEGK